MRDVKVDSISDPEAFVMFGYEGRCGTSSNNPTFVSVDGAADEVIYVNELQYQLTDELMNRYSLMD